MPFENKEIARAWKIKYSDCIEREKGLIPMARFEIISPNGETRFVKVVFKRAFIHDYFHIPGDENLHKNRRGVLKEKEELFKTWALIKIEECLNQSSLKEEIEISSEHFRWAEKIEKGQLQPSSQQQDNATYIYIPERKIGFKTV